MKNILTIVILLNLIICGILIGAPIESTHIPMITSLVLCALYIILSKSKIKIIRNKVDIFIVLLGISTLIPLIFNTTLSITSEINYISKYISAILIYVCVREHIINYPETRKLIVNCIIFSSLILIILGIDNITTKVLTDPLSLINIKIEEIEKNRLSSVFCYSNALAIVIAISIILNNMNYLQEEHKIKKSIYGAITTILMMGLILTYSRLVMLFLAISLIIYCILLRNKIKVYDLIKLFLISTVISCVYSTVFFKIVNNEKYILIWFATVIASLISFILTYYSIGIEKKLEKIKIKKIVIVALLLLSIIVILVFSIKGKLDVFKNSRNEYEIQLGNIEPNKEYIMQFDFEEVVINKNEKNLKIELIEMNEFTDKMVIAEIDEKEFLETGQIKVTTKDTTTMMKIVFSRISNNCKIIINKFTINGQNRVLDYKLIPDDIEDRINNTFMTQKGFYERKSFIEDGIKLIKDNLLFGKGGNAWEYEQYNYQQNYYMATQVHCYIIQLGIEYGILAMVSFLSIIVLTIYRYIKSKNKYD